MGEPENPREAGSQKISIRTCSHPELLFRIFPITSLSSKKKREMRRQGAIVLIAHPEKSKTQYVPLAHLVILEEERRNFVYLNHEPNNHRKKR